MTPQCPEPAPRHQTVKLLESRTCASIPDVLTGQMAVSFSQWAPNLFYNTISYCLLFCSGEFKTFSRNHCMHPDQRSRGEKARGRAHLQSERLGSLLVSNGLLGCSKLPEQQQHGSICVGREPGAVEGVDHQAARRPHQLRIIVDAQEVQRATQRWQVRRQPRRVACPLNVCCAACTCARVGAWC